MNRTFLRMLVLLTSMTSSAAGAADAAPAGGAARSRAAPHAKAAPHGKALHRARSAPGASATHGDRPEAAAKAPAPRKLPKPPALPVAQIVDRNIAARGGLAAWRAVNTVTMAGEMDAGGTQEARLPFLLSMKRPQQSRLEIRFEEQTAVQVWDGKQGWKVRPFLNRNEVEPFTAAESRSAEAAAELDGPLVDHARKGTKVELEGTEVVEGKNTYKLRLTLRGGQQLHLWIDASSFLETKIDGDPRRIDGRMRNVAVFYRDFRRVGGLQFPSVMETVVEGVEKSHKMTVETIRINPTIDDGVFARPQLASVRHVAR